MSKKKKSLCGLFAAMIIVALAFAVKKKA